MDIENRMEGYILLHRALLDNEIFTDPHLVQLWIYLLLMCNHKDNFYNGVMIKRGQHLTGRIQLSQRLKIGEKKVENLLNRLEKAQQIAQQKTNKYRIVTVLKYDMYQSSAQQKHNKSTTEGQQTHNRGTQTINDNNDKNDINNIVFKVPSIDDVSNYCLERKNNVNPNTFIDFYSSKGWMVGKNKMKDWKAAVRTWEKSRWSNKQPLNKADRSLENARKYIESLNNEKDIRDITVEGTIVN